jgi:hypothetical protein
MVPFGGCKLWLKEMDRTDIIQALSTSALNASMLGDLDTFATCFSMFAMV